MEVTFLQPACFVSIHKGTTHAFKTIHIYIKPDSRRIESPENQTPCGIHPPKDWTVCFANKSVNTTAQPGIIQEGAVPIPDDVLVAFVHWNK